MAQAKERTGETVLVYGRPRAAVNFVTAALTRAIDPMPVCIEVREGTGPAGEVAEAIARRVGTRRMFVAYRSEELIPPPPAVAPDGGKLVAPTEGPAVMSHLTNFFGLADRVQELWSEVGAERPRALLVLNSDHVSAHYPPQSEAIRAAFEFFRKEGVTMLFGHTGEIAVSDRPEEHIVRVTPHPEIDWTLARVSTMRGARWHFDDQPIRGIPLFGEFFRQLGLRDRF